MSRRALLWAGAAWAALLAVSLGTRLWTLVPVLPSAVAAPADRAAMESGDPRLHRLLDRVRAAAGTDRRVVLFVTGLGADRDFVAFRAAYELFPIVPEVVAATRRPTRAEIAARLGVVGLSDRAAVGGDAVYRVTAPALVREIRDPVTFVPPAHGLRVGLWLVGVLAILAALVVPGWAARRTSADTRPVLGTADRLGLACIALAAMLAFAEALVPRSAWSNWDAWAVWDIKVKALRAPGGLMAFLRNPAYRFAHQEYPPGWPGLEAALAGLAGRIDTRLLRLWSVPFAAAMPFLLAALLAEAGMMRGRWLVAGLVGLMPAVLDQSSNGYVDWPLATVMAGAMLLLLRALRGAAAGWAVGWVAGLAANLKNEGVVWGAGCLLALALAARARTVRWREVAAAAGVWVVLVAPWRLAAAVLGLHPGDFGLGLARAVGELPLRLAAFLRAVVLEGFGAGLGSASFVTGAPVPPSTWLGHLCSSWLLFWYLAAFALVGGWRRLGAPGTRALALVLAVQVASAAAAYALTIRDVHWLLAASLDRLMLQWVPGTAVLAAAAVQGVESDQGQT